MAKQVIWTQRAQNDRKEILQYWRKRNKSNEYSKKLSALFKSAVRMLSMQPKIGRHSEFLFKRVKAVEKYLIIYLETKTQIIIQGIWDTRRDPGTLKNR